MKKIICIIAVISITIGCDRTSLTPVTDPATLNYLSSLFTVSDAEKILREPAHLIDSSATIKNNILAYSSAYFADKIDTITGKTGSIYFTFEKYDQISLASKKYTSTKKANENNGIQTVDNMGDEAYFHTDGQGFYFIMVRKGVNVFNLKVNKITSNTSLEEFKLFPKKITNSL